VLWAIENIFLSEFVKSLPQGLDSLINLSGHKLYKSIIQRIIIARSIVNRPKLVLLENHIDFIEEPIRNKIIDFLVNKTNDWTLISISTNSYLQQKSDYTLFMSEGEIINKPL
jgi:ABC-type transport system involved in cytochrome bd biosynthesis fused ATPase/permease subunit